MKLVHLTLAIAVSLGLAACAGTEGPHGTGVTPLAENRVCSIFGAIDRDRNGLINQAEWGGFRAGVFNDWDTDDDNRISRDEFGSCWRAGGFSEVGFDINDWDDNFGVFDDDNDGFLRPDEFWGDDEFGAFDTDDDLGIEPGGGEWGF